MKFSILIKLIQISTISLKIFQHMKIQKDLKIGLVFLIYQKIYHGIKTLLNLYFILLIYLIREVVLLIIHQMKINLMILCHILQRIILVL